METVFVLTAVFEGQNLFTGATYSSETEVICLGLYGLEQSLKNLLFSDGRKLISYNVTTLAKTKHNLTKDQKNSVSFCIKEINKELEKRKVRAISKTRATKKVLLYLETK